MLIVQNKMPLHAIVRSWMLLAVLRAAHELVLPPIVRIAIVRVNTVHKVLHHILHVPS